MQRTRFRVLAVVLALAAVSAPACRIPDIWPVPPHPPIHPPPPPPRVDPVLTRLHKAEIRVTDNVAQVEVAATFFNPNSFVAEGTYFFPIEATAVVRDFAMTVDGREQKAELLDADRARQVYEDIVRRQRDPGLLEYVGTRMLKCRVFPIQPNSEIKVRLNYTQVADSEGGVYRLRYPLSSAKPNAETIDQMAVRVSITSATPIKLFHSPTHKIDAVRKDDRTVAGGFEAEKTVPTGDFDVYWSTGAGDLGVAAAAYRTKDAGEDGYFMISLTPRVEMEDARVQPKDVVFVFDKSGSMAGAKMEQARRALSHCLGRLNAVDRFSAIVFSTDVDTLTPGLTPATAEAVAAVRKQVETVEARGGTAIHDALARACEHLRGSDRLAMIVFLTDGRPTIGPVDIAEILKAAATANTIKARLFVFGVGNDVNTDLLDRLATEQRGTQTYVRDDEDIEVKVSGFYDKVSRPVLTDVTLDAPGVKLLDMYPRQVPDIFHGSQVLVFGRYRGESKSDVVARGRAEGKERVFECQADFAGREANAFIPAVWAHRKVAFLLEEIRLRGKQRELEDEVVALGRKYGIMTPYTSFLVAEDVAEPDVRRVAAESRGRFEALKSGAEGVAYSHGVARAKGADLAPAAAMNGAPAMIGMREADADDPAGRALRTAMVERLKRVADKVFYLKPDGFYYDAAFSEADRGRIEDVAYLSDRYFELLRLHPAIGRYLASKLKLVLCIENKVYRVAGVE